MFMRHLLYRYDNNVQMRVRVSSLLLSVEEESYPTSESCFVREVRFSNTNCPYRILFSTVPTGVLQCFLYQVNKLRMTLFVDSARPEVIETDPEAAAL